MQLGLFMFFKIWRNLFLIKTGQSTLPFSSLRAMEQLSSIKQGISRLFFIVAFYMNALHKLFYSTLPRKGRHNTALSFFTKGWLKKTSFHIALLLSYLGRLTFVKLRTLLNLSNFFLPLRHFHRVFWRCLPTFSLIGHVRYINIQAWVRGFRIKIANFSSFFCPSIPIRDLDTKETTPNIKDWPESLGAMLEYWYLERGLLEKANSWLTSLRTRWSVYVFKLDYQPLFGKWACAPPPKEQLDSWGFFC